MSPQAIAIDKRLAEAICCVCTCAHRLVPLPPGIWPSHHEKAISLYRIVAHALDHSPSGGSMRKRTVLIWSVTCHPCGGLAIDAAIAAPRRVWSFDVSSGPSSAIITQRSGSFDCLATSASTAVQR